MAGKSCDMAIDLKFLRFEESFRNATLSNSFGEVLFFLSWFSPIA